MNSLIKTRREETTKTEYIILKDTVNYTLRRNLHIKGVRQFLKKEILPFTIILVCKFVFDLYS